MNEKEKTVLLSVPNISGNELKYVKECLETGWISSAGSYVDKFEQMVADYAGTKYGIATMNGTAALHIALLLSGGKTKRLCDSFEYDFRSKCEFYKIYRCRSNIN